MAALSTETQSPTFTSEQAHTLVCTSITAASVDDALSLIEGANISGADVLELRLDFYKDFDEQTHLMSLMGACKLPVIVTYRPKWEGGEYEGEEGPRLATLRAAADGGAAYIDVELEAADAFHAASDAALPSGTTLILSHHNFTKTLPRAELVAVEGRMRAAGAGIAKIAMTAQSITDAWTMLELLQTRRGPMIALSMGEAGVTTRILAGKYGGFLTFGALAAGCESAPGQPTVSDLRSLYRVSSLSPATLVFGIIGSPVRHSRSPALHNAAMAAAAFDGVYVPLLVDDMDAFMATFRHLDWAGFSVTIPHKEAACRLSDADSVAAKIGAVNTLVRRPDGSMAGHNTDWDAAISAVEAALRSKSQEGGSGGAERPLEGLTAVVLGTGGAARALAFGAAERGATVVVAGRNVAKAAALAEQVAAGAPSVRAASLEDVAAGAVSPMDVVLNTTPLGMSGPNEKLSPLPQAVLEQFKPLVFDAVYTPLETTLLREAEAVGCVTVTGLEMFVGQAAEQFKYFTELEAPVELMRKTVLDSLA